LSSTRTSRSPNAAVKPQFERSTHKLSLCARSAILPRMRPQGWFYSLFFLILTVPPLEARVVRVEIASRQEVSSGKAFGYVGVYERVTGRVFFSVPVANAHNRSIVDLDKAVNLNYGAVEFSADFMALRPKDSSKSNGSWLLEIPNRGRGRIVSLVDGGDWDVDRAVNPEGYKPLVCRSIYYRERRSPRSNPAPATFRPRSALSTKYPSR
jgi:hypothetical protein